MTVYNYAKLHRELVAAEIPIDGVSADGRIDFKPAATAEQRTLAEQIKAAHDPTDYEAVDVESARGDLRSQLAAALALMQDREANWASITAAQQTALLRTHNRVLIGVLRLLQKQINA